MVLLKPSNSFSFVISRFRFWGFNFS